MYGRSPVCKGCYAATSLVGCGHVFGPWCSRYTATGPDEVRGPTPNQGIALCVALGTGRVLLIPGLTGSPSAHNHPRKSMAPAGYAATTGALLWNRRSPRITAQMMRAVLLAIATAATLAGRRTSMLASQSVSGAFFLA